MMSLYRAFRGGLVFQDSSAGLPELSRFGTSKLLGTSLEWVGVQYRPHY